MTKYEIIVNELNQEETIVRIDNDGKTWSIPKNESNSDYQSYLRWLENPDSGAWVEPTLTKY